MAKNIELPVSKLKSGMVLHEAIKTKHGQTVAKAGTVLNHQLIARLNFYHIEKVTVENEVESDNAALGVPQAAPQPVPVPAPMPEPVPEPTPAPQPAPQPKAERTYIEESTSFSQKLERSDAFMDFQKSYTLSMEELKAKFEQIQSGEITLEKMFVLENGQELFRNRTPLEIFNMVKGMRTLDDSIYAHCLNVAIISRVIGRWLHYDNDTLQELTYAGLVHDIGKIQIAPEILNKTEKLTDEEFEEIKRHTNYGQKILKACNAPSRVCYAALQHHERSDGSGYPRHLEADEIDDFAAIIGIADVYDAMTAARPYRAPLCAFEVISEFEHDGLRKYNTKFILTFLTHVASMYNNSRVILNDGRTCQIVYTNRSKLSSPIVQDVSTNELIDLSTQSELYITKTL